MKIIDLHFLKRTLALTTATAVVAVFGFVIAEPATSSAQSSDSTSFTATLSVDQEISVTDGGNITMSPNIGLSSDASIGSTTLTVETNNDAGYTMTIEATGTPAMVGTTNNDQFADYTPSTTNTPDAWTVDASSKEFGYGAHGGDALSDFNSGSGCGTAADPSADGTYYEGLDGTTTEDIASNSGSTADGGNDTIFCVAAEQNGVEAESGTYEANLTATATTN